jgi:two-component sensor histidine kinase
MISGCEAIGDQKGIHTVCGQESPMTLMAAQFVADDEPVVTIIPAAPEPTQADEINHRVANSLQLLSAMVSIAARGIEDPMALAALDMTQRRIGAIASVHRQLYQARETSMIDLGAYLQDLGRDLEDGYANATAGRRILVRTGPVAIAAENAIAIGIIVSELVGNACKYAYAPDEPGDVRIALRALPFGGYTLEVSDSGRGMTAGVAPKGTGLGKRLIAMMAARLEASHDYLDAMPGTRFMLRVAKH